MKLNICSLLVVLLYNHCLLHPSAESAKLNKNDRVEKDQHAESTQSEFMDDKLTFADLDEDCLYIIFQHLDLMGLLNVAEIMPESIHTAASIFRQRYSHYNFKIMSDYPQGPNEETRYEIYDEAEEIHFYHLNLFQNVWQHFGTDVKRIAIENEKDNNLTMANRFVNEYCSESVNELDLKYISPNELLQYSKPFNALEKLTCRIWTEMDGNFTLKQLFPNLHQLRISLDKEVDFDFIDCAFPHLTHLKLKLFPNCPEKMHQIEGLIRKNPQVKSIYLEYISLSDLPRIISEVTPNLDYLFLQTFRGNNPIHFGNVKHFCLFTYASRAIDKLTFSHLDSLEIRYMSIDEDLSRFFKRHEHLKRLHVMANELDNVDMDTFTADLPNLVEVIFEDRRISDYSIIHFVNSRPKLMKFQIRRIVDTDDRKLLEAFENDWHIQSSNHENYKEFIFQRKNDALM